MTLYKQQLKTEQLVEPGLLDRIDVVNTQLRQVQEKIEHNLPQYQELVDALDVGPKSGKKMAPQSKSIGNIQVCT